MHFRSGVYVGCRQLTVFSLLWSITNIHALRISTDPTPQIGTICTYKLSDRGAVPHKFTPRITLPLFKAPTTQTQLANYVFNITSARNTHFPCYVYTSYTQSAAT